MPTATKQKEKIIVSPQQFATVEQFNGLTEMMKTIVDAVKELKTQPITEAQKKTEEAVRKAGPDRITVNSEWEEDARAKIGEALDHCEVLQPKGGGMIYVVYIKQDFSNAPKEYWEMYKADKRTCDVGNGGFSAVQAHNALVAQNLKRGGAINKR